MTDDQFYRFQKFLAFLCRWIELSFQFSLNGCGIFSSAFQLREYTHNIGVVTFFFLFRNRTRLGFDMVSEDGGTIALSLWQTERYKTFELRRGK